MDENSPGIHVPITADTTSFLEGVTKAGDKLKEFSTITPDAKGKIKGLAEELTKTKADAGGFFKTLDKVTKSLFGVSGAFGKAHKAATGAKVGLTGFKAALASLGIGLVLIALDQLIEHWDDIKAALDPTIKEFNKLNKALDDSASKMGVLDAEIGYTKALIKLAKEQGKSTDELTESLKDQLNAKLANLLADQALLVAKQDNIKKSSEEISWFQEAVNWRQRLIGEEPVDFSTITSEEQANINDATKAVEKNKTAVALLVGEIGKLNRGETDTNTPKIVSRTSALKGLTEGTVAYYKADIAWQSKQRDSLGTTTKELQAYNEEIQNIKNSLYALREGGADFREPVAPLLGGAAQTVAITGTEGATEGVDMATKSAYEKFETGLTDMEMLAADFSNNASNLIVGSIAGAFTDLGTSIGEAMANGENVFGAIGDSLLGSMASFLSDMGAMLIEYGTLAVVKGGLDLAIKSGGPWAIAAGVAAIAVGIALTAAGASMGTRAESGMSGSTGSTGGSGSNTSGGTGGSYGGTSSGNGTVVFKIAGRELVGVLAREQSYNLSLGGS